MGNPQDPYGQQPYQQPPQQPYQQPYGGQVPPPPQPASQWGRSSMGMEATVAAGLSYLWILGVIFFFIEKTNKFVKFHAAQATVLAVLDVVIWIVWFVLSAVLTVGSAAVDSAAGNTGIIATGGGLVGCLLGCAFPIIGLVLFAFHIWGLILGFTGKYQKLPLIGDIAERLAGGPAAPAM
jgi:uncharacterized membrane protein